MASQEDRQGDLKVGAKLWEGPPTPPDSEEVARDVSCQGTIAKALYEALVDMQEADTFVPVDPSNEEGTQSERTDSHQTDQVQITERYAERIMQSFGEAVVRSQRAVEEKGAVDETHIRAPACFLNGRIDHYNRYGSKWRIVVEDARFLPRKPPERGRRKRDLQSLWNNDVDAVVVLPRLEVLAYNDIE